MKNNKNIILVISIIFVIIAIVCHASADGNEMNTILNGEMAFPVKIVMRSPSFMKLSQFGKDRIDGLNRILKHVSIEIAIDGALSETEIYVDNERLFQFAEKNEGSETKTVYSFDPGSIYQSTEGINNSFGLFLDDHFFELNRMLDQMYHMFENAIYAFPELTKESTTAMNYKDYGKAVKKITIQFSADCVKNSFPQMIAELCEKEETKLFVEQYHYSGPQKIILMIDQNNNIINISYTGTVGLTEQTLRRISFSWRCLRTENKKQDHVVLKTPSVKGYDKYNMIYERKIDMTEEVRPGISWDLQLDIKDGDEKKKIQYNADCGIADKKFSGTIEYTEKQNGQEHTISIIPEFKQENTYEYSGTIEITEKKGKIINSSLICNMDISHSAGINDANIWEDRPENTQGTIVKSEKEGLQNRIYSIIIRKLLSLPAEDIEFLRQDIPDDLWDSILQLL